ncbi:hypothetical protein KFK09_017029 [Dendrobium nobile]|uniref:Uncharacterized protein n=1 Tax=Dendrobium nobile TaxID=94219 RepID=A0A8T3AZX9_DENNO|nr:hypothetical protein KFK09_017029 [Dendrobium nobile]
MDSTFTVHPNHSPFTLDLSPIYGSRYSKKSINIPLIPFEKETRNLRKEERDQRLFLPLPPRPLPSLLSDHHLRPGVLPDHHLRPELLSNHQLRPRVLPDHHLRLGVMLDHDLRPRLLLDNHLTLEVLPDQPLEARSSAGPPSEARTSVGPPPND